MANKLKIITMTRLALYDKHEGPGDRVANDYFRHDYIYRNNLGTRLAVGLGGIIILLIYWLQALMVNDLDIFNFDIQQHVTDSVLFLLAILAVYSLIGSIQGTRQYYLVQKRLAQYQAMVRQLERLEERSKKTYEEEDVPQQEERPYNPSPPVRTPPIERTRRIAPIVPEQPRRPRPPQGHTRPPRPRPHTINEDIINPIEHTRAGPTERTRAGRTRPPRDSHYKPTDTTDE